MKQKPLTDGIILKQFIHHTLALGVLGTLVTLSGRADNSSPGYVDFGEFSPPVSGGEFVEVHIRSNLIAMVARLAEKNEPEVAELLRGLQLIRVNVVALDD